MRRNIGYKKVRNVLLNKRNELAYAAGWYKKAGKQEELAKCESALSALDDVIRSLLTSNIDYESVKITDTINCQYGQFDYWYYKEVNLT